jgi:hypothetical protein
MVCQVRPLRSGVYVMLQNIHIYRLLANKRSFVEDHFIC